MSYQKVWETQIRQFYKAAVVIVAVRVSWSLQQISHSWDYHRI